MSVLTSFVKPYFISISTTSYTSPSVASSRSREHCRLSYGRKASLLSRNACGCPYSLSQFVWLLCSFFLVCYFFVGCDYHETFFASSHGGFFDVDSGPAAVARRNSSSGRNCCEREGLNLISGTSVSSSWGVEGTTASLCNILCSNADCNLAADDAGEGGGVVTSSSNRSSSNASFSRSSTSRSGRISGRGGTRVSSSSNGLWGSFFGGFIIGAEGAAIQKFHPPFHKANDYNANGITCASLRPGRNQSCPFFGLPLSGRTAAEFTAACKQVHSNFGCGKGETLFVDGSCKVCPEGYTLKESKDNVWCESASGKKVFHDLVNPLNCGGSKDWAERTHQGFYRPCYAQGAQKVLVPEYYNGSDLNGELTMKACAIAHRVSGSETTITQNGVTTVYQFPLISDNGIAAPKGYLQCQAAPPKPYSFTTKGWCVWYSLYLAGGAFIAVYALHKKIRETVGPLGVLSARKAAKFTSVNGSKSNESIAPETKRKVPGSNGSKLSMDFGADDTSTKARTNSCVENIDEFNKTTQVGYSDSWLGYLAFLVLIALSVGLHVGLFILVLDLYGMHLYTLCTDEDVKERCEKAVNEGIDPNWREGYPCASGCVFSMGLTNGEYDTWPYNPNKGGGKQQLVIFVVLWHITVIWTIYLKMISSKIRSFFRVKCYLEDASTVLCMRPPEREVCLLSDEKSLVMRFVRWVDRVKEKAFGESRHSESCTVYMDDDGVRFIDLQCLRCCWSEEVGCFTTVAMNVGSTQAELLAAASSELSNEEAARRRQLVGQNAIHVSVPSIPRAMFEEFFDYFYFYQLFCLWVWYNFMYWPMGTLILIMVVLSGLIKVLVKRSSQKQIQRIADVRTGVRIKRDGYWIDSTSDQMVPGDIVSIQADALVPCDMALVEGRCVVDESSLTGEPTPVPKIPLGPVSTPYKKSGESMKYSLLAGTYVESVSPGPSRMAIGIVIDTGAQTDKGQLIRSILFPPKLTFQFDQHWKIVFIILLGWGVITAGLCIYMFNGMLESWYYGIFNISQVLSPLIPAVFVAGEAKAANRLKRRQIFCVNLHRIMVAGKVKIFCFDKTGTITKTGLDFYGVQSINERGEFAEFISSTDPIPVHIGRLLGCCHELDICTTSGGGGGGGVAAAASSAVLADESTAEADKGPASSKLLCLRKPVIRTRRTRRPSPSISEAESDQPSAGRDNRKNREEDEVLIVGNEVDKEMFAASEFVIQEASSQPLMYHAGSRSSVKVLRRFEFDRNSMSMSVVVEDVKTGVRSVYCKGSYERIAENTAPQHLPDDYQQMTRQLAKDGFYVLGISQGVYGGPDDVSETTRECVESNLRPIGLLMFRNDLKPDSMDVIEELKEGSIRPVMITGDNALTAAKIAKQSGLSTAKIVYLGEPATDQPDAIVWRNIATEKIISHPLHKLSELRCGISEIAVTGTAFELLNRLEPFDRDLPVQTEDVAWNSEATSGVLTAGTTRRRSIYEADPATGGIAADSNSSVGKGKGDSGSSKGNSGRRGTDIDNNKPGQPKLQPKTTCKDGNTAMQQLLPYTRIFARMKPDQKVDAVMLQMERGVTGMCGDGANDAGALRISHCGIALAAGDSEASIVAPFSTSHTSLTSVLAVIKEGRSTLATAVAGYKQLILYGEVMTIMTILSNAFGIIVAEPYWITVDGIINIVMAWAVLQTRAATRLAAQRPTASLLGLETIISVTIQVLIAWFFIIMAVVVLFQQDWFLCKEFDANLIDSSMWWLKGDNFEGSVIGLMALLQYVAAAAVFSFGFDYRRSWFRNYWLLGAFAMGFAFCTYLLFGETSGLTCLFRANCGDWSLVERWISNGEIGKMSKPSVMPEGCACTYPVEEDKWCEAEYVNCQSKDIFNQSYHHNILPYPFRGILYSLMIAYLVCGFCAEGLFVVGPVRRWLRRRRKSRKSKEILSLHTTLTFDDSREEDDRSDSCMSLRLPPAQTKEVELAVDYRADEGRIESKLFKESTAHGRGTELVVDFQADGGGIKGEVHGERSEAAIEEVTADVENRKSCEI